VSVSAAPESDPGPDAVGSSSPSPHARLATALRERVDAEVPAGVDLTHSFASVRPPTAGRGLALGSALPASGHNQTQTQTQTPISASALDERIARLLARSNSNAKLEPLHSSA